MQNRDQTFLQKLKDNAFYVALGLGLLAILAVVAVYTMGRGGTQVAENDLDLNQASDYTAITTEDKKIEETNAKTANQKGSAGRTTATTEDKKTTQEVTTEAVTEQVTESTESVNAEQIPVTTDVGELDFTSDKTLTWPVNGDVILPYSMETTVHFKTLDQYQCNPGMLIAAGNGTTVKNAYLGKVTKVTSDNMYGNLVTLYIGNDYSIVYGQLDTIYVKEGDYVKAGESIGTIGNPTDSFTEEGSHLFFQMLEGEKPIDPMMFIE
ncbi:MAG: M23 family metallopeptidase [Lachnospiraceae bacterium]|nr:M23 family metallopeptidase [Lachnospiraceae bacterium]